MFTYVRSLFAHAPTRHPQPFPTSELLPGDIEVHVGKKINRRTIRIPQSTLEANSTLKNRLSHGAIIANVDPHIFEVALEFLKQAPFLETLWRGTRGPFKKLTAKEGMLLDLAKAWHLGEMLDLPAMQNGLIEAFSARYRQLLAGNVRIRISVSPEPFKYLRDNVGNWTKCEVFIIDFLAGFGRHGGDFVMSRVLGMFPDIVQAVKVVRHGLEAKEQADLIKEGNPFYKVTRSDTNRPGNPLRVLSPAGRHARNASLPTGYEGGLTRSSSVVSLLSAGRPNQGHRYRHSLAAIPDHGHGPSGGVSHTLEEPELEPEQMPPYRLRRPSRSALNDRPAALKATDTFFPYTPERKDSDDEDTDDERFVYAVLPPEDVRSRHDSHQFNRRLRLEEIERCWLLP